jgi:SNF2 family DNA or RNA helicase
MWLDHYRKYYPDYKTFDLSKPKEFEGFFGSDSEKVGVVSYQTAWRRKKLLELHDFVLVCDESSNLQNTKAKQTKFILKLNPKNVVLLSGTPVSGKYENLYSQLHLLGWDISEKIYNAHYVNWKKIFVSGMIHKVVDKDDPYKNVERLKQKMREHGAVFMKTEDVFDLPKQNFITINVPATKEYRKFKRDHLITIDTMNLCEFKDDSDFHGKDVTPRVELVGDSILSFRLYQRQLCSAYNPHKIQAFKDLLESTQDRLIVFYNFNCELEILQSICNGLNKPCSIVNGSTKDLSNYEQESNSVTLVQYKAGAMGLNLQKANKIVYFSLTEEAELFEQSKKRVHRIGQEKPCFYYILICQNSIEDQEILPTLDIRKTYTDELFNEHSDK